MLTEGIKQIDDDGPPGFADRNAGFVQHFKVTAVIPVVLFHEIRIDKIGLMYPHKEKPIQYPLYVLDGFTDDDLAVIT